MKPEPTRATQGISFELPILRAAKERAVSKRMSLSAYVNQLIFDDLSCHELRQKEDAPLDGEANSRGRRITKEDSSI